MLKEKLKLMKQLKQGTLERIQRSCRNLLGNNKLKHLSWLLHHNPLILCSRPSLQARRILLLLLKIQIIGYMMPSQYQIIIVNYQTTKKSLVQITVKLTSVDNNFGAGVIFA